MLYQRSSQLAEAEKNTWRRQSPVRAFRAGGTPILKKVRKALIYMMKMETV
jgi:hypothetical protein